MVTAFSDNAITAAFSSWFSLLLVSLTAMSMKYVPSKLFDEFQVVLYRLLFSSKVNVALLVSSGFWMYYSAFCRFYSRPL